MNRRTFMTRVSMAAAALAASRLRAQNAPAEAAHVRVRADPSGAEITPDFIGLGFEISSVARSGLLSDANHDYVQLVRRLGARGVIRVGGNTADYARYAAGDAPVSTPFGTVVNDAVLGDLGSFLRATGWKLIWGLNLGNGSVENAVAEAKAVAAATGEHLTAFETGNEPDLFSHEKHRHASYSYEQWLADYRRYKAAVRAALPASRFAGPDVAGKTDWVTRFAADEGKDIVLLTHHYYREGQNPASTIEKLLGPDPKLNPELEQLRAASKNSGVPYRICEVNSFSGGGRPGVSDTLASALWVLDYMFRLAANGCAGVNMETGVNQLGFVSSYSPIGDDGHAHYSARPEYYGMLAFAEAGKGRLLATEVDGQATELAAYATRSPGGVAAITLINKGGSDLSVRMDVGSLARHDASVMRLRGPALDAKAGITLGGAEVDSGGAWKPATSESVKIKSGRLEVALPPASAAILRCG
jgi:hypothetical protein